MATLQIIKKLSITPLIDIQSSTFAERYVSGVYWRLFGWRRHGEIKAQGPLPEDYLIDNLNGRTLRAGDPAHPTGTTTAASYVAGQAEDRFARGVKEEE